MITNKRTNSPSSASSTRWDQWAPEDAILRRRPLTEIETGLVRLCSLRSPIRAGVIGATDAGAASGELARLTIGNVICDSSGQVTELDLSGTERTTTYGYPVAAPRSLEVPE
jgi:hypothetical protein